MLMKVVLPAPFWPTTASRSPACSSKSTPRPPTTPPNAAQVRGLEQDGAHGPHLPAARGRAPARRRERAIRSRYSPTRLRDGERPSRSAPRRAASCHMPVVAPPHRAHELEDEGAEERADDWPSRPGSRRRRARRSAPSSPSRASPAPASAANRVPPRSAEGGRQHVAAQRRVGRDAEVFEPGLVGLDRGQRLAGAERE